jgi:energy-coupling factor transporter ATP-binding protein EcfA2
MISGSTTTPQQKRKICRPRLWDGGLSAKSQTFDELHRAEIDRHHYKFILGPSYRGQRKYRIAPKLLEAAPMNMPGGLEARALSEIVAVIKAEEGVFDEYWMNPSSRALWYLPRALSKLHRWEEFVHYLCNPDYVIEAILEYGVLEVLHNFENALGHIIAQRSNTTAFSTLKQQTIDTCCQNAISSYLDFVRKHREALASSPRNVFALALATKGRVQEDAWSQITDLQALLNRCVQKLPHQEIDTMVRIYRALERAREHGLDTCLPLDARDQFESVADEMSQAMQRMWQSTKDENVLESCADQLLGLSGNHAQQRSRTQMVNQGFKDLALVVSGAPQSPLCSPSEAYIVLSVRRPQRLPDVEIVQVVAACAGVPDDQLQVVMRRGTSVVLRILQKSERQGDNKISGAIDVRDRILQMASDPNSPLRQSGIVQGRGIRSGRWEHVRIALSNTCDMEYEREYLVTFVLPALRVECRKRKILLTWSDLGSSMSLSDEETEREALNRMKALQLCGIQPPGCNMRPFLLSLLGSRCGKTFQDIMKSQVNDYPHPVQSAALSKLEWIWRKDHLMYSIPYLQVCDAYLRCIDASESMFILRNHEWLSDPNVANRMPAIIHDKFCEQSDEMNQVVTQFKQVIQRNAERQNRIITYNPKFLSLLGPKFVQDNAEMPEDVFRTDYRRLRSVVIVNKNFWQEMKLRGNEILQSCNGVHKSKGMVSKKELRHILEQHKVLSLLSDAEMVRLIAAYEVDANGSIDYAALINQFVTEGRVRMSGMATLGLKVYQRLLNTIDAYFPISVPPGTRHDWDLNEQEALLDIYASATCNGVNDHIFGQLKDFASSHETLDAVAVRGSSGSGKSTLMASFARFCIVELGHSINIIFYCYQPWHGEQDIIRCLVGQLDRSILDHAQERGQTLSVRALETGLARHAQTRSKDVLIIADGLLLSEIEDQIVCTVKNHNLLYANRARVVFTAVPAEHHSADDVLSLSILPLMPSEKLKLVHFQESRDGMSLYPQVVADLCKKPNGANNAKFLVVAVKFLSHFRDQEHMQILHEMPDNVKELYGLMIFPLLERIFSMQTIQHIFVLLFFEGEGGLLRSELAKLAQHGKMKEHDINELCENLRSLGIAAVTAESDRFIITCDEVKTAIHDRYVSSHSRLKDKLHEVLALEKVSTVFCNNVVYLL